MKKKTTPKNKTKRKPVQSVEIGDIFENGLSPVNYVALSFQGRFFLAGLFIQKAFVCLFKGRATV
jgi:hypothetical protein